MSIRNLLIPMLMATSLVPALVSAEPPEPRNLRQKQEDQQRARAMARELMVGVLDIQLRQLEENGLTDLQVYRDIRLMRDNIGSIVDAEMSRAVDVLASAQSLPAGERDQALAEARQMIRTIVLRLSAERQTLLRRLKTAELSEQVQRLRQLQSKLIDVTGSLPEESRTRQEAIALQAVEDQRDVRELFSHLVTTLNEVQTWGGPLAHGAEDGLRILKAAQTGRHLDLAVSRLEDVQIDNAVSEQQHVLRGLGDLLKVVDRTQGLVDAQHEALLSAVRELTSRQQALREQVRQLDGEKPSDELVQQQAKLQKELAGLDGQLGQRADKAQAHADRAAEEAFEATAQLLDGDVDAALQQQGDVLGHLAELEALIEAGSQGPADERSAENWRKQVAELEAVRNQLQAGREQNTAAQKAAPDQRALAADHAQRARKGLEQAADLPLAPRLADRIAAARDAAAAAEQKLLAPADSDLGAAAEAALEAAEERLDRALAAVNVDLQEARNTAAAVEISEKLRAAEVLDRVAAGEREVAAAAKNADQTMTAEAVTELAHRQQALQEVADRLAGAVAPLSQVATEAIERGRQSAHEAAQQLQDATQSSEPVPRARQMQSAAPAAQTAASELAAASQQLRTEAAATAEELAQSMGVQSQELTAAREQAEAAAAAERASEHARLAQLESARQTVAKARQEQHKAAGNPAAAAALQLQQALAAAQAAQAEAAAETSDRESHTGETPVAAAAQQQAIADAVQAAASQVDPDRHPNGDPLRQAIQTAQQSAADAARQLLDREPAAAAASQNQASEALAQAADLAAEAAQQAEQAAPRSPQNTAAQQAAAALARQAAEQAEDAAPAASETLNAAAQAAEGAATQLAAGEQESASPAQQTAGQQLAAAEQQLASDISALRQSQSSQLGAQAAQLAELARQAGPLDSGAGEALQAAADAARQGALPSTPAPQQQSAMEQLERQLERAVANLAAGEQQKLRDQSLAAAVAAQTAAQQAALGELLQTMTPAEAAAQQGPLSTAMAKFADSLKATGQGVAELSGQSEILNPDLRAALEMASQLAMPGTQSGDQTGAGQPSQAAGQPEGQSSGAMPGQSGTQTSGSKSPMGSPAEGTAATSGDGEGQGAPQPSNQASGSMGTGVVPKSPVATARQMLGSEALAAMEQAMAALSGAPQSGVSAGSPDGESSPSPADSAQMGNSPSASQAQSPNAAPNASSAAQSGLAQGPPGQGQASQNSSSSPRPSPGQSADSDNRDSGVRTGDADIAKRSFREEAWFAKLPPELRKSLRGGAGQKAPRAYEERLRKYFQSVDD